MPGIIGLTKPDSHSELTSMKGALFSMPFLHYQKCDQIRESWGVIGHKHPYADNLKKSFRLFLDLLENAHNLWYAYFNSHGCFSFLLKVLGKPLLKENRPFFYPPRIYTKNFTLPIKRSLEHWSSPSR